MKFHENLFEKDYFPREATHIPFGSLLNGIFFDPNVKENGDYPIHGPNVIRFLMALINDNLKSEEGLLKGDFIEVEKSLYLFGIERPLIMNALGMVIKNDGQDYTSKKSKTIELLKLGAFFHDIGKSIRRANHPRIGYNLVRNDETQRRRLIKMLVYAGEDKETFSKYNRFSLLLSIIHHHDKFGVVSTGEAALPIFSDIPYYTSTGDENSIKGTIKNVTSVMLLNLADIAAVCTASDERKKDAVKLANKIHKLRKNAKKGYRKIVRKKMDEILKICKEDDSTLGLSPRKISTILKDWKMLVDGINDVSGNRTALKQKLLKIEMNPSRTIERILRILRESAETSNAGELLTLEFFSESLVQNILSDTLGDHQLQTFSRLFATITKLDYGLKFFKAVVCACIRKVVHENYSIGLNKEKGLKDDKLNANEKGKLKALSFEQKQKLSTTIITLFVKVLNALTNRYIGVLNPNTQNPRRFGYQMKHLTSDAKIKNNILTYLCLNSHTDHPKAITWILDEITIWPLD